MTTETTSQSLHERLREAAERGQHREGYGRGKPEPWQMVPVADIATIEAAMIAEVTAPLRAIIDKMEAEFEILLNDKGYLREELNRWEYEAENRRKGEKYAQQVAIDVQKVCAALRAENAALREAGNALHDAALAAWDETRGKERLALDRAMMDYRAATTDAGEVKDALALLADKKKDTIAEVVADAFKPSEPYDGIDFVQAAKDAADRNKALGKLIGLAAPTPTDADTLSLDNDPHVHRGTEVAAVFRDIIAKHTPTSPAPTPTDAAGEGKPAPWEAYWIEASKRLSDQAPALQARDHRERIDDLITRADGASDRLDMHMRQISDLQKQMNDLQEPIRDLRRYAAHTDYVKAVEERIAALEAARTPDPEPELHDVPDAMVRAYWEATHGKGGPFSPTSHVGGIIRAGLAAALKAGGAR